MLCKGEMHVKFLRWHERICRAICELERHQIEGWLNDR
jgi:hypothetical protein